MTKITISYEFDYHEDQECLRRHLKGKPALDILEDIDQEIRNTLKYGEQEWLEIEGVKQYLQDISDKIWESGVMGE